MFRSLGCCRKIDDRCRWLEGILHGPLSYTNHILCFTSVLSTSTCCAIDMIGRSNRKRCDPPLTTATGEQHFLTSSTFPYPPLELLRRLYLQTCRSQRPFSLPFRSGHHLRTCGNSLPPCDSHFINGLYRISFLLNELRSGGRYLSRTPF
jgi:hypothetical protein